MRQITFHDLADETLVCLTKEEIEDIVRQTVRATEAIRAEGMPETDVEAGEASPGLNPEMDYYGLRKAAKRLGVAYGTVARWIEHGLLPAVRIDDHYYISAGEINRVLEHNKINDRYGRELVPGIPLPRIGRRPNRLKTKN